MNFVYWVLQSHVWAITCLVLVSLMVGLMWLMCQGQHVDVWIFNGRTWGRKKLLPKCCVFSVLVFVFWWWQWKQSWKTCVKWVIYSHCQGQWCCSVFSVYMFPWRWCKFSSASSRPQDILKTFKQPGYCYFKCFKCSICSPEDGVNSHRNMSGVVWSLVQCDLSCIWVGSDHICDGFPQLFPVNDCLDSTWNKTVTTFHIHTDSS
jgi:hypothetical protein